MVSAELVIVLVLGANLGGAIPPVVATLSGPVSARRVTLGNLAVRTLGCLIALPLAGYGAELIQMLPFGPAKLPVDAHLAFNLLLAALAWPFSRPLAALMARLVPDQAEPDSAPKYLDAQELSTPVVALASATREVLGVGDLIERMNGAFSRLRPAVRTAAMIAVAVGAGFLMQPGTLHADDSKPGDDLILQRLDNTHLAYVVTGEQDVDNISDRGLEGLTQFLTFRTTLEPAPPVGIDLTKDELSFYPIIYWPVSATAPMPSSAAISRIDAYMRNGGTVLFDTRDQISALDNGGNVSANGERLQAILANLDIPALEPVPSDHVLTKSFYLLSSFPGRYAGSPLWIEARQGGQGPSEKSAATADGVSPILITGNDFAGAWAIDENGVPILPTVPPDETQREYAYRSGVNIMGGAARP